MELFFGAFLPLYILGFVISGAIASVVAKERMEQGRMKRRSQRFFAVITPVVWPLYAIGFVVYGLYLLYSWVRDGEA